MMVRKIIKRDIKNLFSSRGAIIVMAALIIIPACYSSVNIVAFWNPMGNIGNLKIGVINYDNGTLSQEIVTKLIDSKTFNCVDTDYREGYDELNHGRYYGLIIIPNDFTTHLESINTTNPSQAEIQLLTNTKASSSTSTMMDVGISGVQTEINNKVVSTVNGIIFDELINGSANGILKVNDYENRWNKIDQNLSRYYLDSQLAYNDIKNGSKDLSYNLQNFMTKYNISDLGIINEINKFDTKVDNVNNQVNNYNNQRLELDNNINYFNMNYYPILSKISEYNLDDVKSYFNSPVLINKTDIHPLIANGIGIAEFYIPLSLWIGSVLLVAMLSIRVKGFKVKHWEEYFSKLGLFQILAVLQAIVITAISLFLGVQNSNPLLFLCSNIFIGFCFTTFVYSLVSTIGNIGKFMAIIILVFSIGGSGGMYPIELMPGFFQILNKLLPMTYAINITKEVVIAPMIDVIMGNVLILLLLPIIGLILALLVKPIASKFVKKFESEIEKTDLFQ
ncbi:MAG: YhgE/Pip family protein [Methanobrevibacter sp.]|jgi:putative membrane protein|nr:YhgE/Pip family protein [Methanobrevibacter sp.]